MKRITIVMLMAYYVQAGMAQDPRPVIHDSSAAPGQQSYLQAGISYLSNVVFAGRKDSVAVPYVSPSLGYFHKSGLFAQSSLSFLVSSERTGLDLVTLMGGYMMSKPQFAWGVMGSKYFFSDESYNVQSAFSGNISAYAGYDIGGIITAYADAIVAFGDYTDFFAGLELGHAFYMGGDKFSISPALYGQMGTQYYYNQYYTAAGSTTTAAGTGRGSGRRNITGSTASLVVDESSAFRLLSIEVSLPMSFNTGNWQFYLNPVYVLPQSPSEININGTSTKEILTSSFYVMAGITYKIGNR